MYKCNIICPIRKANPYRRMMKAIREHSALPNSLKRNFKPGKVLLTDITYLFYGKGQKAYLSTVKGAANQTDTPYLCIALMLNPCNLYYVMQGT